MAIAFRQFAACQILKPVDGIPHSRARCWHRTYGGRVELVEVG
ncbi:Uncharacterised protein [Vibrio cholerae]|nr:Uncharacterised protein [Vibrio cholerae]